MPVDPSLAALEDLVPDEQDTPETPVETDPPVEDTDTDPQPIVDFEDRYNNLRSFSDRRHAEQQQLIQQYEAQLEAARQAQQRPAPDYDGEEYEDDPLLEHVQQLEANQRRLEQQLAARAEVETRQQQQAQINDHIDSQLDAIEAKVGELADDDVDLIVSFALRNPDEFGNPDVALGYQRLAARDERQKSKWVSTKQSAPAPATGPGAVEVPDLDDPDEVDRYLNQAFEVNFGG